MYRGGGRQLGEREGGRNREREGKREGEKERERERLPNWQANARHILMMEQKLVEKETEV